MGDVESGPESSVWLNTDVPADAHYIRKEERTNVRDNRVLRVTHEQYPLINGSKLTVGHGAILHAASPFDCCLTGMGATVLDDARPGPYAIIAVASLVPQHFEVPEGSGGKSCSLHRTTLTTSGRRCKERPEGAL
jgi:carbonic anhydrase/acetyltransferase-like protein (isoleucine patch superfamily)